jgi:hypothetical protein
MPKIASIAISALSLTLVACERPKPQSHAENIEVIAVSGTCKEDHATKSGQYTGVLRRDRDTITKATSSIGFVRRIRPSTAERVHSFQHPEEYQPPDEVYFLRGIGDTRGQHLVLHGVANKVCGDRQGDDNSDEAPDCVGFGYATTCALDVTGRRKILPNR